MSNLNLENNPSFAKAVEDKKNINEKEIAVLEFWNENKIFEKSLNPLNEDKSLKNNFTFYDGPPFATGLPHHGHLLAGTIKDAIPRYQTMKGNVVRRVWGWDCHGLPLENLVEKELNLNHKNEIEEYGIKNFVEKAKSMMLTYENDWKKIIPRMGRWVDMENAYKTMDTSYSESVWWSFKTLYDKGLIYEGHKSMHICPRCETTLAQSEVALGYKDLTDISVTVKFELEEEKNTFILAWTTTPWTLPGNTALAINKNEKYIKVKSNDENFIFAKERLEFLKKDFEKENKNFEIIDEFDGEKLIGKKYKSVFKFDFEKIKLENMENIYKIWHADFITMDTGTGIAHQAPAFGAEDLELSKQNKIPVFHHVKFDGSFEKYVNEELLKEGIIDKEIFEKNIFVKTKEDNQSTDILIIKYLAKTNSLFSKEKIIHSYPTCWRCETPLLNYATSSWFMDVPAIKNKNLSENQKINWIPEHIKNGRFGKWLEGSREWALSRQRYWGASIPVWKCDNENCKKVKVIENLKDLENNSINNSLPRNDKGEIDIHRPYIDEIKLKCDHCNSEMTRIKDVFDCWYESGSMPFASIHYLGEKNSSEEAKKLFKENFPANFIAEGLDQTRGWFYSLLNLSVGLFEQTSFKNCIVSGLVMAGDGEKMSKSKKNYTDPLILIEKYGADSFRYSLLSSPIMNGENLPFPDSLVEDSYKKVVSKLENILSFYQLINYDKEVEAYISEDINLNLKDIEVKDILNKWILIKLDNIVKSTNKAMDEYRLDLATRPFEEFIDDFSTWYLRRSREKLKNKNNEELFIETFVVFRNVLDIFSKIIAPFMPFIAERVYQEVNRNNLNKKESVHLESFPTFVLDENSLKERNLILEDMNKVREIVSEALMIRQKNNIPVRQCLSSLTIKEENKNLENYFDIIKEELNIKEIILGKEIFLDTNITEELKIEGDKRELSRQIKDKRKEIGLFAGDNIILIITKDKINLIDEEYKKEMKIIEVREGDNFEIKKA